MAKRPVFTVTDRPPYYGVFEAEFPWAAGLSLQQKRKNVESIHRCYENVFKGKRALEISSKSTKAVGNAASAFFLKKRVDSLDRSVPVECIFQSSKVFSGGGPYVELLEVEPIRAKRDERLKTSGALLSFRFEGVDYPINPKTAFYDYLYVSALLENPHIAEELCDYDGFTDVAFTPEKSLNCQARSAAIFVSLKKAGKLEELTDFSSYLALVGEGAPQKSVPSSLGAAQESRFERINAASARAKEEELKEGTVLYHKTYGKGQVVALAAQTVKIDFDTVGQKTLGRGWVAANCILKEQ